MLEYFMNYITFVKESLLISIRNILKAIQNNPNHEQIMLYISFDKQFPGVKCPNNISNDNILTIIIQHQYWNLRVYDDGFFITLMFDNNPEEIYIPFKSIIIFADPTKEFILDFQNTFSEELLEYDEYELSQEDRIDNVISVNFTED